MHIHPAPATSPPRPRPAYVHSHDSPPHRISSPRPDSSDYPPSPQPIVRSSDSLSRFNRLIESTEEFWKRIPVTSTEELLGSRWSQRTRSTACESSPGESISSPIKEGNKWEAEEGIQTPLSRSISRERKLRENRKRRVEEQQPSEPDSVLSPSEIDPSPRLFSSPSPSPRLFLLPRHSPMRRSPLLPKSSLVSFEANHSTVIREYFPNAKVSRPATPNVIHFKDDILRLLFVGVGHRNAVTGVEEVGRKVKTVGTDYCIGSWRLPEKTSDPYRASSQRSGTVCAPTSLSRIHKAPINAIRSIADTRYCTSANDSLVKVSLTQVWKRHTQTAVLQGDKDSVFSLAVQNGDSVVGGARSGMVHKWDLGTGKEVRPGRVREHRGAVGCVEVYNEQTYISGGGDCVVKLWDVRTERSIATFSGHQSPVTALVTLPANGFYCASDPLITQWDIRKSVAIMSLTSPEPVFALTLVHARLISAGRSIHIYPLNDPRPKSTLFHKAPIRSMRFFPESSVLATVSSDQTLAAWSLL